MRLFYNLIQLLLAPVFFIVLPVYLLARPEKCKTIFPKLGLGVKPVTGQEGPVVWIHALSVGEVTSALPLVRLLKETCDPAPAIVFTASTVSGLEVARRLLPRYCDQLTYAPIDILPAVRHFIKRIDPDLFILIETDFWPNLLYSLQAAEIPALLVNGRVSDSSMRKYRRFAFFFRPLFDRFDALCMQSEADVVKITQLGIDEAKIHLLGNLKFGHLHAPVPESSGPSPFPEDQLVILAGSTHDGEELIILEQLNASRVDFSGIHLAIAPRNIDRVQDIATLAQQYGLSISLFSQAGNVVRDVTIIDTIGDLSALYAFSDICFIGGSLVDQGGHNPIEAASAGRPVLFGPSMDDFTDVSRGLIDAGGAIQVLDAAELGRALKTLLVSPDERSARGRKGFEFVLQNQHVLDDHLTVISPFL